jgi:predicted RNase H-like HicB family nuclease
MLLGMRMKYRVVLQRSEEGYAVSCPGCWSQGETEEVALDNIRSAISEYLAAVEETAEGEMREVEVAVCDAGLTVDQFRALL